MRQKPLGAASDVRQRGATAVVRSRAMMNSMTSDLQVPARGTRAQGTDRVLRETAERVRRIVQTTAGLASERVTVGPALVAGHFRRRRRWNCVVAIDGSPLAAIHAVHIPTDGLSETTLLSVTDRLLAQAIDASKAATTELVRPWLGAVVVIDSDAFWNEVALVTGDAPATHLDRLAFFIERVVAAQLLDAAMVIVDGPARGQRMAARLALSEAAFDAALAGRAMIFSAVTDPGVPVSRS